MTEEPTAAVFPPSPSNAILSSVGEVQGQSLALLVAFATMALYTAERSEEDALVFLFCCLFVLCVCVRERDRESVRVCGWGVRARARVCVCARARADRLPSGSGGGG